MKMKHLDFQPIMANIKVMAMENLTNIKKLESCELKLEVWKKKGSKT